jgi:hypothetical protein
LPDSFILYCYYFILGIFLFPLSYFGAMTLLYCVNYFPFYTLYWMAHSDSVLESPTNIFPLNVIHSIVGRYYSFIFNLPKISDFAHFIPKGTEQDQTHFPGYLSLCCACKIKKYKTRRQRYSASHFYSVTSLMSFESCSPFYFPLCRKYFYVLKTPPKVERVTAHLYRSFPQILRIGQTLELLPATDFIHLS